MRWACSILLGSAIGSAASLADVRAGGLYQQSAWRALGMLLNAGSVWAALAVTCGWLLMTPGRAAAAGFLGLVAAVMGYYVVGVTVGDRVGLGLQAVSGAARFWLLASVILGPVLGLIGAFTWRRDGLGLIAALVVPVGIFADMAWYHRLDGVTLRIDPWLGWTQLIVVGTTIVWGVLVARKRLPKLKQA
jgi:hypothetical protein